MSKQEGGLLWQNLKKHKETNSCRRCKKSEEVKPVEEAVTENVVDDIKETVIEEVKPEVIVKTSKQSKEVKTTSNPQSLADFLF